MSSIAVTDDNFGSEVLMAEGPVLVDFWAEWCGPCKVLLPLIDQVASELQGKLKVVKVNIDQAPKAPSQYGVRGIPTLMIFKGGKAVATRVGGLSKTQLYEWVEGNIQGG